MKRLCLLVCLMLLVPLGVLGEGALSLQTGGEITGFQENTIAVTSPFEGQLTLCLSDAYNTYRTLSVTVPAGDSSLTWDGLGENEERLITGKYTLRGTVAAADGRVAGGETTVTVGRCRQALLFALPGADTLYLEDDEAWFLEGCLVRAGTVIMDIYRAGSLDKPIGTRRKQVSDGPFKFTWNGNLNGRQVTAGDYVLRLYASSNKDTVREIRLSIREGRPEESPLTVPECFMPERGDSDGAIWEAMMQPSVVIDVKNVGHQKVYDQPSKGGKSLGELHGQSQAVQVMELLEDGWALIRAWNHECGAAVEGYVPASVLKLDRPNSEYGLLLDKQTQQLTVFFRGQRLTTLPVSTGLMAKDKLFRETPAGMYLTLERVDGFSSEGYYYDYAIRYDGGNLLHQLGYKSRSGRRDFSVQTAQLGQKASHGCIRLPAAVDECGVNAYWLWTHLPYHTRVVILDDPQERAMQQAVAEAGGEVRAAKAREVAAPPALLEGETELLLTLGGDAVLGTRESWQKKEEALPAFLEREGMGYPFAGLQEWFASDDMTFINLECVLKADRRGESTDKLYRFRGLPEYAAALVEGSVEQVNIANNHYIDYGQAGREATREALDAAGVPYSGFGYTYVWECQGHRIGFGGCRETVFKQDRGIIARDIAALKAAGCEVIVYSCHWGEEYSPSHNELQETMAREAAACGADMVVGTHPHVVQGIDTVEDTVVLYSLGNLMFGGTIDMTTFDAMLARVGLRFGSDGVYQGCWVQVVPILTSGSAPVNDYRPEPAQGEDRQRILMKIQADSGVQMADVMWFPSEAALP